MRNTYFPDIVLLLLYVVFSFQKGLVLGVYCNESDQLKFTATAESYDKEVSGKLSQYLDM